VSITVEREGDGKIALVPIRQPGNVNLDDLAWTLEKIADDAAVSAILLGVEQDALGGDMQGAADVASLLEDLPQPVVACVEGAVADLGLELILGCDLRVCSEDAVFSITSTGDGRVPSMGGTQRLPRLIGRGRASAMLLMCEPLGAAGAYRAGLVNEVVSQGATLVRGREIAARIAGQGPIAVRYAKEAVRRGLDMPLDQALRYETDLTIILQTTDDRAEGVRAFLEKRLPRFRGT
jgi:enoyl-CoA hydratase/carnithine racemase